MAFEIMPEPGVTIRGYLPDGRLVDLIQNYPTNVQLKSGPPLDPLFPAGHGYEDIYTFQALNLAIEALIYWIGSGDAEPDGWLRHQPSNRRRPAGDAEKEYIWA